MLHIRFLSFLLVGLSFIQYRPPLYQQYWYLYSAAQLYPSQQWPSMLHRSQLVPHLSADESRICFLNIFTSHFKGNKLLSHSPPRANRDQETNITTTIRSSLRPKFEAGRPMFRLVRTVPCCVRFSIMWIWYKKIHSGYELVHTIEACLPSN